MQSRMPVSSCSGRPRNGRRPLLAVYFPLGDPEVPVGMLDVHAETGVDIVELGWPARDPHLDGPDVRASMARASGGDPRAALRSALQRLAGYPQAPRALLMTYAETDHPALADATLFRGLHAVLAVGPPNDPSRAGIEARARRAGAAVSVFMPLPVPEADLAAARGADGYVMLQAAPGVTGPRAALDPANGERVARLREAGVAAPIVLGFGVSEGAQARAAVALGADGIVVGSAALRAARRGCGALGVLLRELRNGLDG
jgi:tryptophan synthase alpha chain